VPTRVSHPILKRVGSRLRQLRRERGYSQEEVALRAGLDRSYVSGLERGEFNVSVIALAKIARALGVKVGAIFDAE
jgi:transcriptional regulator with XRE-family HTH domain